MLQQGLPSSDILSLALTFLTTLFNYAKNAIKVILDETLLKNSPQKAALYSDAITLLITLTALYLILEFVTAAKKVVRVILALGWLLLILSLVIRP